MSEDKCFICQGKTEATATSSDGLAVAVPFRSPRFPGHMVVAPTAHRDIDDVAEAEWAALGAVVQQLNSLHSDDPDFEKIYLVAIGDADPGHLHFHVIPKQNEDQSLGPFVFGPSGWVKHNCRDG